MDFLFIHSLDCADLSFGTLGMEFLHFDSDDVYLYGGFI
jgi:hypothetical protein